ncbi:MAG: hypothetical protein EOP47_23905, partial [Sphingobacteriaceae bacterium]
MLFSLNVLAQVPTITSFSPVSGQAGTVITINGTNFSAIASNNIVRFNNGIKANVTSATTTKLTVSVSAGAESGPITILNKTLGLYKQSILPFKATSQFLGSIPDIHYNPQVNFATTDAEKDQILVDIDDDGKPDLVSFNSTKNSMVFFRNTSVLGSITTA